MVLLKYLFGFLIIPALHFWHFDFYYQLVSYLIVICHLYLACLNFIFPFCGFSVLVTLKYAGLGLKYCTLCIPAYLSSTNISFSTLHQSLELLLNQSRFFEYLMFQIVLHMQSLVYFRITFVKLQT